MRRGYVAFILNGPVKAAASLQQQEDLPPSQTSPNRLRLVLCQWFTVISVIARPTRARPNLNVGLYITNVGPSLDLFATVGEPVVDFERGDPLQIRQLLP